MKERTEERRRRILEGARLRSRRNAEKKALEEGGLH